MDRHKVKLAKSPCKGMMAQVQEKVPQGTGLNFWMEVCSCSVMHRLHAFYVPSGALW